MAIITAKESSKLRQFLLKDHSDLLAIADPPLTKVQLTAIYQAFEDWFEGQRLAIKADVEAAAGVSLDNAFIKKFGKHWMGRKMGLE